MFRIGKRKIAADILGRNLVALTINADDCWRDVCMLRSYKTVGPVATCEIAFARAALVKSIFGEQHDPTVTQRLNSAADTLILESFSGEDTQETRKFFRAELAQAAPQRVAFYTEHAWPTAALAAQIGARLGVPGIWAAEIAPLFDAVEHRVRSILNRVKVI